MGYGLDDERFDRVRPDVEVVRGLELSWNHGLDQEPANVGLSYLYSLGNTGHLHLATVVQPGVAPADYPVAVVDEGGYTIDIIASSIFTWLPCFLVRYATETLHATWLRRVNGWAPVPWREEQADLLLAQETELRTVLDGFRTPGVDRAVAEVLERLRQRHTLEPAQWRPDELYTAIEPDGYVSAYHRIAATHKADPRAVVARFPLYNKPLFAAFDQQRPSYLDTPEAYRAFHAAVEPTVRGTAGITVAPEFAHEVFHRRTKIDTDGVFENDLLDRAAERLVRAEFPVHAPIAHVVQGVAEHGARDFPLGDAWYEAGLRWEAAGDPTQALICYENAIRRRAAETGGAEWHQPATDRLRALALALAVDPGDGHYLAHVNDNLPAVDEDGDADR